MGARRKLSRPAAPSLPLGTDFNDAICIGECFFLMKLMAILWVR
jgi:hypothetical protein